MTRHVVLVGLPGAGKTTVGRRAAEMLSAEFTDIDELVEAETGRSIAAIFADPAAGEAEFRRRERSCMDRVLARAPQLIAAGGGWIVQPGNLEAAAEACLLYLRVSPEVAAERIGADPGRPLLAGRPNPAGRLQGLLADREPWYLRAEAVIDARQDPETVAAEVTGAARRLAGW